jgi:predicted Fe-Mo cluster-binding NifX family protein
MRIVVSAQGENLEAPASPVFGRCPIYLFVDTETMQFEAVPNPAMNQGGGAGIQAAQFVVEHGARAVLTGNLGPNAFDVLEAASVPGYLVPEGTVRQAVEALKSGQVQPLGGANVAANAGMRGGAGLGGGRGMGRAMGMGQGMGRGMGRGIGMGQRGGFLPVAPNPPAPEASHDSELAQLHETLKELRQQLAETMDRIDRLEKEE